MEHTSLCWVGVKKLKFLKHSAQYKQCLYKVMAVPHQKNINTTILMGRGVAAAGVEEADHRRPPSPAPRRTCRPTS